MNTMGVNNADGGHNKLAVGESTRRGFLLGVVGCGVLGTLTACGNKLVGVPANPETTPNKTPDGPETTASTPHTTTEAPQPSPTEEPPLQKWLREHEERKELLVEYINMPEGKWSALAPEEKREVLGLTFRVARETAPLELTERDECDKYEGTVLEGKFDPASDLPDAAVVTVRAHIQAILLTNERSGVTRGYAELADGFVRRMAEVMLPDDPELASSLGAPIKRALDRGIILDTDCAPPLFATEAKPSQNRGEVIRRFIRFSGENGVTDATIDWHPTKYGWTPVVVKQIHTKSSLPAV